VVSQPNGQDVQEERKDSAVRAKRAMVFFMVVQGKAGERDCPESSTRRIPKEIRDAKDIPPSCLSSKGELPGHQVTISIHLEP
jgi:hypothetical protein